MDKHFHVWVRRGRAFLIVDRPYTTRSHANKDAEKMARSPEDRMVRGCSACPPSSRSRRRVPSMARVAAAVAAAVGADAAVVRVALDEAMAREKNGAAAE